MQAEIQTKFDNIDQAINILKKHFNLEVSLKRIREFNDLLESEDFWNDIIKAQSIMKEKKQLEKIIDQINFVEIEKKKHIKVHNVAKCV